MSDKHIYVVWGSSDVGGHDLIRKARPLANGEHVFFYHGGVFEQDPQEPVFGHGKKTGSTPMRYFADKLSGLLEGDDIAFMSGIKKGPTGGWHDGLEGLSKSAIRETVKMLAPALEDGWELEGVILAIGPGDADTPGEVQSYGHRFHKVVHHIRKAFGDFDLDIFNMQTFMPKDNTYPSERAHLIGSLRQEMVDVENHRHNIHVVTSSPAWDGVRGHSGNSHLDVQGQVFFGHHLANEVFHFGF